MQTRDFVEKEKDATVEERPRKHAGSQIVYVELSGICSKHGETDYEAEVGR